MNEGRAEEYEYRVVAERWSGNTCLPYGTRCYPNLYIARGLATRERRYYTRVWLERRPVVTEWEVVE